MEDDVIHNVMSKRGFHLGMVPELAAARNTSTLLTLDHDLGTSPRALASGCHVIGYSGGGGRELFGAPSATLIHDDCVTDLAEAAWKRTTTAADGAPANRDWAVSHYGQDALTAVLLHAVSDAAALPSRPVTAQHPVINLQHLDPAFFAPAG